MAMKVTEAVEAQPTKKLDVEDNAEKKAAKPKDGLLEARRILKRIELLERPEQRLVFEKLKALVGEEG